MFRPFHGGDGGGTEGQGAGTRAGAGRFHPVLASASHADPQPKGETDMLGWALAFLVIALIAGVLGFGGIAGTSAGIAQVLFVVFIILFIVAMIARAVRGGPPF
jgi:uncharacterized membrane protein YtjA (UPF0391 family)